MAKGWKAIAVAALTLWWSAQSAAQPSLANPNIQPGEPLPIATYPNPVVTPMIGSPVTPGGPSGPVSLIDDGTPNAFQEDPYPPWDDAIYFRAGALALVRSDIGNMPIVREDLVPIDRTGMPVFGRTLLGTNNMPQEYVWGPHITIGVQNGDLRFELNGFWLDQNTSGAAIGKIGSLNLPFGDFPPPFGFVGNNNIWRQADFVQVSLTQRLGSAELLCRIQTADGFQWLLGGRYVDMYERFNVETDDDSFALGETQPLRQATHSTRAQNRVVAPTFGFEYTTGDALPLLAVGMWSKFALGANFADRRVILERGDGARFPGGRDQSVNFASVIELGGFFELNFNESIALRGGYQALWLLNVYEAAEQVNFNPANRVMSPSPLGNVLYHGPKIELRLRF